MKSKMYTLTGDKGTTSLVGGKRVSKDDLRVEAYGTIDEVNSWVGLIAHNSKLDYPGMHAMLRKIQNKLFNIGSYLATDPADPKHGTIKWITEADIKELESKIDEMDDELPPLKGFILPGGSRLSSLCGIARTVTRRAERRIVALSKRDKVSSSVLKYVNRLSDFFFVFARFNNIHNQFEENYWQKNCE